LTSVMEKTLSSENFLILFSNRYQWTIGFVQGFQNHFVLKNKFTKLGHNSVEVNYRTKLVI